ncbi:MAG: 4a-hydroxytetrahydrobiopterin dehydratase [Chloroflexi bacterium]|nr:4a-hydroxytetrahydrobiopterin dehydratase [Chloroflexota bacterium]MDK1044723.1 4a-hydroxytetrahydrobiopterin dehydratase [Anaerolineales bacterium]MCH8093564.1 4a-hydroxytetrahydrobiopterin dehydratase [Chloroflexota bacterium]MCH8338756.1 4a-hydroxytetrahydrobiopterin dehydratase [Chloroflexota bacterium]MCH8340512.1 4a-hydroxytetrahydrobiopterin dehydratase [Chloroflexota bacterium]
MTDLADRELNPPRGGGTSRLEGAELQRFHEKLGDEWEVIDDRHLEKQFKFKDFQTALDFVNKVGELAESVDHHPDLCLGWGKASITIWTHSIDGLSEADFVFAARADRFATST